MLKKIAIAGVVVIAILTAGYFGLRSIRGMFFFLQQNPGPFDRDQWEAVVAGVRSFGVAPGETKELRLDPLSDPKSLRIRKPGEGNARGQGAGNVWAQRTATGILKVVIETRDLGHAGEYGFAYSEAPLSPSPFEGQWQSLDVPSHLTLVLPDMRIDEHWWEVVYNLD